MTEVNILSGTVSKIHFVSTKQMIYDYVVSFSACKPQQGNDGIVTTSQMPFK